jgi:SAM-dependent methyltransferase
VGVDLSQVAIDAARKRALGHPATGRVRFIAGDLTELGDIGEPFDLLLDRGCYHLMRGQDLTGFLGALERFSRPGTVLFLLAFCADEPPEFPNLPVVSERELRSELGGLFAVTDLRTCRLETPLGFEREPLFWSALLERR